MVSWHHNINDVMVDMQTAVVVSTICLIGLSFLERPYLVQDLNLITKLHVIRCVNWRFTNANWWFTDVNQPLKLWFTDVNWQFTRRCKVLNFIFTSVLLITLLNTVEVTPFFLKCKPAVYKCKPVVYKCKLLQWTFYMCSSHNCAGQCGGNTFFSCVNLNLSRFTSVNCKV